MSDDDDDVLIRCLFEMLMLFVLPSSERLLWKEVLEDGKLWQLDAELHANQSAGEEGRGELVTLRVKPKWAWLRQVCKVPHTRQSADLHAEKKTAGRAEESRVAASLHHPIIFFLPAATGLELPLLAAGCQSGGGLG